MKNTDETELYSGDYNEGADSSASDSADFQWGSATMSVSAAEDADDKPQEAEETQEAIAAEEAAKKAAKESAFHVISEEGAKFDYVVPKETFKKHARRARRRHRHHKHHHSSSTDVNSPDELQQMSDGYVFIKRKNRKKSRRRRKWRHLAGWKKTLIVIGSILLALILVFGSAFLILREIGRSNMHNYDTIDVVTPSEKEDVMQVDRQGRVITYEGKSYILNENLVSVSLIGIDDGTEDTDNRRMADAIYIVTVDTVTGQVKLLCVSRDTMAEVNRYSVEGKFIDTTRQQIAYSYSYRSDTVTGGMNTNASLSKLFYGLPMKNHFAINLDALVDLNDAVGGVTVNSMMTFESPVDGRTIYEGENVTLRGEEAERYVRSRDMSKLDSNNQRMQRQQQYIRAFLDALVPSVKADISRVGALYGVVRENSESNLGLSDLTYLASVVVPKLRSASDIQYVNMKGDLKAGEHPELTISDDEAIRTMLNVFYLPQK